MFRFTLNRSFSKSILQSQRVLRQASRQPLRRNHSISASGLPLVSLDRPPLTLHIPSLQHLLLLPHEYLLYKLLRRLPLRPRPSQSPSVQYTRNPESSTHSARDRRALRKLHTNHGGKLYNPIRIQLTQIGSVLKGPQVPTVHRGGVFSGNYYGSGGHGRVYYCGARQGDQSHGTR